MPNCDWGRPCDCIECRTTTKSIVCSICGFDNTVEIIRDVAGYSYDRKGMGSYEFTDPAGPLKDLTCFKCGNIIKNVVYDSIHTAICQRTLDHMRAVETGRVCTKCQKVEGDELGCLERVILQPKNGSMLCQYCLADVMEKELPDPSNDHEKYTFDRKKLQWTLSKVKMPCVKCGKMRWLNVENRWRKLCGNCFKAQARVK